MPILSLIIIITTADATCGEWNMTKYDELSILNEEFVLKTGSSVSKMMKQLMNLAGCRVLRGGWSCDFYWFLTDFGLIIWHIIWRFLFCRIASILGAGYPELQYLCQIFSIFPIENAERMENLHWKRWFSILKWPLLFDYFAIRGTTKVRRTSNWRYDFQL